MPEIDIADLKKNTEYQGYRVADKEIVWFWNNMFSLTRKVTKQHSCSLSLEVRNGFSDLQGTRGTLKFAIHKASGPAGALLSAHTCFNSLDLPTYNRKKRRKGVCTQSKKEQDHSNFHNVKIR